MGVFRQSFFIEGLAFLLKCKNNYKINWALLGSLKIRVYL